MPPSQVAGFNDYDPKYSCCCHVRSCSIIIGALCTFFGGIGLILSVYKFVSGVNWIDIVSGSGAVLFMFLAGCFLLHGIFKEKSGFLIPFLVFCAVDALLLVIQTGAAIYIVVNDFDTHSLHHLNYKNYCDTYGFARCDRNSMYYIIAALIFGLIIMLLIIGFFFNRVYRARQYLNEKDAARGAGYQMGIVQA